MNSLRAESHYLTNQVFRKTYVQIKRSIDDWLRLKNMKKVVKIEKSDQKIQNSKDVISIQELIQYKLQYKCFTRNQIRAIKRPPNFPSRKQRQNTMMSQYTYSSVNMTENQDNAGGAFEIVHTAKINEKISSG